jgi:hypothetical protein
MTGTGTLAWRGRRGRGAKWWPIIKAAGIKGE